MQYRQLPRLYIPGLAAEAPEIVLMGGQHHYLAHVLRKQPGDTIRVFTAEAGEWVAEIQQVTKKQLVLGLREQIRDPEMQPGSLFLAPALIKPARFSWLLEKATELGVEGIYPLTTMRTQVKPMEMSKMQAIVTEAAEQCERLRVPVVHAARQLRNLILPGVQLVVADEQGEGAVPLRECDLKGPICWIIGPEGGWHDEERRWFQEMGLLRVYLGSRILRSETACMAVLAYHML